MQKYELGKERGLGRQGTRVREGELVIYTERIYRERENIQI